MTRRSDRVADLLRAELSTLLVTDMADPRVRLTTVSAIDLSPDLRQARVRISVLGDEGAREAALVATRHAAGFLRSRLAHRLRQLRVIPQLRFELDRGAEHSQRISNLLDGIHDDERT